MKNILILGGAGFLGSQLAERFSKIDNVTVIDGLVKETGGSIENLSNLQGITFIQKRVEDVSDLSNIISKQDIIIDSMGWTSHLVSVLTL